jgi:hypothetical protein
MAAAAFAHIGQQRLYDSHQPENIYLELAALFFRQSCAFIDFPRRHRSETSPATESLTV